MTCFFPLCYSLITINTEAGGRQHLRSESENTLRSVVLGGMLTALGVLLPIVFHAMGLGKVFLPMHIPVFLAGFVCGPAIAMLVGIVTPLISSVFTGMPPFMPPIAQAMVLELAVYGLVTGYLFRKARLGVYVSMIIAIISGRIVYGVLAHLLMPLLGFPNVPIWAPLTVSLLESLPGVVLQLVVVPGLLALVKQHRKSLFTVRRATGR